MASHMIINGSGVQLQQTGHQMFGPIYNFDNSICRCTTGTNGVLCVYAEKYVSPFYKLIGLIQSTMSDDLNTITVNFRSRSYIILTYKSSRIDATIHLVSLPDGLSPRSSINIVVDDGRMLYMDTFRMSLYDVKIRLQCKFDELSKNVSKLKTYNHFYYEIERIKTINNIASTDYHLVINYRYNFLSICTFQTDLSRIDTNFKRKITILSGEISHETFDQLCEKLSELTELKFTKSGDHTKSALRIPINSIN